MGPEAAVKITRRKDLAAGKTDAEKAEIAKRLELEYKAEYLHPYIAAEVGYIDDVIDPRDTRPKLIAGLEMMRNKVISRPRRKHGNIPL